MAKAVPSPDGRGAGLRGAGHQAHLLGLEPACCSKWLKREHGAGRLRQDGRVTSDTGLAGQASLRGTPRPATGAHSCQATREGRDGAGYGNQGEAVPARAPPALCPLPLPRPAAQFPRESPLPCPHPRGRAGPTASGTHSKDGGPQDDAAPRSLHTAPRGAPAGAPASRSEDTGKERPPPQEQPSQTPGAPAASGAWAKEPTALVGTRGA